MTPRERAFLVLRAQSGDRAALDALLRDIQGRVYRHVRSIVGQEEAAEDVLQDVFVIICRKIQWLREPEHFVAWTLRIASREAVRRVRKGRREEWVSDERLLGELEQLETPDPIRGILAERVAQAVDLAPAASRSVLSLHYLEDMTLPEVASVLGVPLGTAKSRLAYGLRYLRRHFAAEAGAQD